MKFEEALVELRKGKKIKEIREYGREFNLSLENNEIIILNYVNDRPYESLFERIIKCQWEVIEEPGKTFSEVFEAFKKGKKIRRKSNNNVFLNNNTHSPIFYNDLLATDWEVIE